MAAAENPELAAGLLLLSYPLHPPNKPEQMRTAFFPELRTPALFVHGTKDGFGSPEELREAMAPDSGAHGPAGRGGRGARPEARGRYGAGHPGAACTPWSDILRNNFPQGAFRCANTAIRLPTGSRSPAPSSKANYQQGPETPSARSGPAPWDLSLLGIRVSRADIRAGTSAPPVRRSKSCRTTGGWNSVR